MCGGKGCVGGNKTLLLFSLSFSFSFEERQAREMWAAVEFTLFVKKECGYILVARAVASSLSSCLLSRLQQRLPQLLSSPSLLPHRHHLLPR